MSMKRLAEGWGRCNDFWVKCLGMNSIAESRGWMGKWGWNAVRKRPNLDESRGIPSLQKTQGCATRADAQLGTSKTRSASDLYPSKSSDIEASRGRIW